MLPDVLSSGGSTFVDISLLIMPHSPYLAIEGHQHFFGDACNSVSADVPSASSERNSLQRTGFGNDGASIIDSKGPVREKCLFVSSPYVRFLTPATVVIIHAFIEDIFTSYRVDFLDIVDSDQRIRWSTFKELCHKLHEFVSQRDFPLVSPQPYSFHRSQLLECVKIILVNVKCCDARTQDNAAVRRYQEAYKTPQLFRKN